MEGLCLGLIRVRGGEEAPAFWNASGAMLFQNPTSVMLGLLFTLWRLNHLGILVVGLVLASEVLLHAWLRGNGPTLVPYPLTGGPDVRRLRRRGAHLTLYYQHDALFVAILVR